MNANLKSAAIAAQPGPSPAVGKFLDLKPRLFINNEWVDARGVKQSGIGRENGRMAIEMYAEVKSVCMMI